MSYTNETVHYGIPLPIGSDLTTPMDYNEAAEAIDNAVFTAESNSSTAAGQAADAVSAAQHAESVAADSMTEAQTAHAIGDTNTIAIGDINTVTSVVITPAEGNVLSYSDVKKSLNTVSGIVDVSSLSGTITFTISEHPTHDMLYPVITEQGVLSGFLRIRTNGNCTISNAGICSFTFITNA